MIFDLRKFVYVEKSRTPYLETIGERVTKILKEIKRKKNKNRRSLPKTKRTNQRSKRNPTKKKRTNRQRTKHTSTNRKTNRKIRTTNQISKKLIQQMEKEGMFFPGWNQKSETKRKIGLKIRTLIRKLGLPFEKREQLFREIMKGLTEVG